MPQLREDHTAGVMDFVHHPAPASKRRISLHVRDVILA
jgi:hypothetical protein